MPLIHLKYIKRYSTLGLWHITESKEKLLELLQPTENELLTFQNISNPLRQAESIAARLVVKHILRGWNYDYTATLKDEFEKPFLEKIPFHIALSHAQKYAVGLVNQRFTTGVDIEPTREKIQFLAHKFLSNDELKFANNDIEKLTILWSAKETLYKIYGKKNIIFKENLLIEPFEIEDNDMLDAKVVMPDGEQNYSLGFFRLENYYISYLL